MVEKLTETTIKTTSAPAGTRLVLSDPACPGLCLRVSGNAKGDVKTFSFLARPKGGQPVRITLGRWPDLTLAKARLMANAQRAKLIDGKDIVAEAKAERRHGASFGELVDSYLAHVERTKKSWKNDKGYLRRPMTALGSRPASSLTRADFAGVLKQIAETAPVSANRTQSVLRTLLGFAVDEGSLEANVLAGAGKIGGKEEAKDRVLSDAELKVFWAALDCPLSPTLRPIELALKMILLTCARPGEVAGMRVEELDLDAPAPVWTLPKERVKNRRAHIVPLSPLAVATIKEALADKRRGVDGDSPYVFASKFGSTEAIARHSLSQATRRMCDDKFNKEHGLKPFTPHDLRRTGATLCRAAGVSRDTVRALLNHVEGSITGVYDRHDMLAEKRDAVEKLAERLARIVA